MAAKGAVTKTSLHQMLNNVERVHKKDIWDYSAGHLNENNLPRQHYKTHDGQHWRGSKKDTAHKLAPIKATTLHQHQMIDTMQKFSMGTTGSLPSNTTRKSTQRGKSIDNVLIQELEATDIMLNRTRYAKSKAWVEDDMQGESMQSPSQHEKKDFNLSRIKHYFASHSLTVTKTDQYNRIQEFEKNILKLDEANETNVMSGTNAVAAFEQSLRSVVNDGGIGQTKANFHRLQAHSAAFDEVKQSSQIFSYILGQIKQVYDDYITVLLDKQSAKHHVLYGQVEQLRDVSQGHTLHGKMSLVEHLETEAKTHLEENERMRQELQLEVTTPKLPEANAQVLRQYQPHNKEDNRAGDLTDQVGDLHEAILEKLDALSQLRGQLRREHVPSSVSTNLTQCIKESEVEIQKLASQKIYFERNIKEMEHELREIIEEADTTERDAKRIWQRVDAIQGRNETDDVMDETRKWDWYIS